MTLGTEVVENDFGIKQILNTVDQEYQAEYMKNIEGNDDPQGLIDNFSEESCSQLQIFGDILPAFAN